MGLKETSSVILIDDNEVDLFIEERILSLSGIKDIKKFSSGPKALEYLKIQQNEHPVVIHWIFLDINMPGMDGFQFLETLNKTLPEIPCKIVIVSSSDSKQDKQKAMGHYKVTGYLEKPIEVKDLEALFNTSA